MTLAAPLLPRGVMVERAEVYRTIEAEGPIFPAAIADRLGLGRTSVQNMVGKLVDSGAVARTAKGYVTTNPFSPPDDSSDLESHQRHRGDRETSPPDLLAEAHRIFADDLPGGAAA